jgi:hypothetical protein
MSKLAQLTSVLALAVLPASCGPRNTSGTSQADLPPGETGTSNGFPVRPGMIHACGESVLSADGTEIVWDIFTSTDDPATVAEYYTQQLGTEGLEVGDGEWTWRMPPGQQVPDRVLSVSAPTAPHPDCPGLPADARTIGNFSQMFHR